MSAPDLPLAVIQMLAGNEMRVHHSRWHFVRDRWNSLSPQQRADYTQQGWNPPRLTGEAGAGLDFLFMHRRMIAEVDQMLATIGDPSYPNVQGWAPIPWDHNDPDWPMPPPYSDDPGVVQPKTQAYTDFFRQRAEEQYENDAWLRTVSLDALGTEMERGIHNWLHMHWSADPWYTGAPGQDMDDPRNDYLGSTYSSHVNKAFWKLHGWIDDRVGQWERANGTLADFSQSWEGPGHMHGGSHHFALDRELGRSVEVMPLTAAEAEHAATKFLEPIRLEDLMDE